MKKKILLSSILSIVLCLSLITGATMALFTSESKVNIAVTSGKVEVVASLGNTEFKSLDTNWATFTSNATFTAGGTVVIASGTEPVAETVTLSNIVPGDGVKFNVNITNNSNVIIKYRTVITNTSATDPILFDALEITVNNEKYIGAAATPWSTLEAGVNGTAIPVSVVFPESVSGAEYMNKTCGFTIAVQAIQGNADTVDEVFAQEDATVDAATSTTTADTTVGNVGGTNATVPAGTKLNAGATTLTLNVTEASAGDTGAFTFGEESLALNVEIPEVAADNTGVIIVTLKGYFPHKPVSIVMFHEGVMMTPVATLAEVDAADEYFYNSTTGDVVFATDDFSNFTAVENVKIVTTEKELYDVAFSQNRKYNNVHNVVVANNITLTKKIQVADGRGDLTIDLNGNTITAEMADDMFLAYSALTVKNGTLQATKAISNGKGAITLENVTVNVGKLGTSLFNGGYSLTLTNVKVNVENFKVNGGALISNNAATKAVFTNTTFNVGLDTTYKAYFVNRSADNVTMTGCTFNIVDANGYLYDVVRVVDEYVADKYAFVQNNKWSGKVSTAWYTEEATAYTITNGMELAGLAQLVNNGTTFAGKTVTLANDIDLNNVAWTPIGEYEGKDANDKEVYSYFEGVFDGNDKTISNLYFNLPDSDSVGLFGAANKATIKNIKVENVDITGYTRTATIVGNPYSGCTISNCHVSGEINIASTYAYAGGIVAYGYVDIDNCSVIATKTGYITAQDRNAVGGIAAWLMENGSSIIDCQVENLVLTGWTNIGSLTGFAHYGSTITGNVAKNIVITKTRDGGNGAIGYVAGGWCYGAGKTIVISDNVLENIEINGNYVVNADYQKGMGVMFGGEYYGNGEADPDAVFVMENNVLTNVVDNRTAKE